MGLELPADDVGGRLPAPDPLLLAYASGWPGAGLGVDTDLVWPSGNWR